MSTPVVAPAATAAVEYPSSDGKPMADNDAQRRAMVYALSALEIRFADRDDVYVSGDLLIYYREGNPRASIAPDVFVVHGVAKRTRMTYLLWEEGKAPDFVLEVASANTWREDEGAKREVYERLGVSEYAQFDPTGEHLGTRLKGARLSGGRYDEQVVTRSASGELTLSSEVLGLQVVATGDGEFRFRDPVTGEYLRSPQEEHDRAEQEAAARRAADARVEQQAARAEREAARAEREAARAEQEAAARRAAEARIAQLLRERRG